MTTDPKDAEKAAKAREKALAAKKAAETAKAAKAAGPAFALSDGREGAHPIPRLKKHYAEKVVPALMEKHGFTNPFAVPKVQKIVVNIGLSEAKDNVQVLDGAREELALITGQWPQLTRAKKSISNFKLREGMPIGLRVTLRGHRMYEFMDRLISTAIPRLRDFRGLNAKAFDGTGNYNLGLREQLIFPEITAEKVVKQRGMNISFITNAGSDDVCRDLLRELGMPLKTDGDRAATAKAGG